MVDVNNLPTKLGLTIMNFDDALLYIEQDLKTNKITSRWLSDKRHPKIPRYLWPENIKLGAIPKFCETRVPPRTRFDIDEILRANGLRSYMPIQMCRISHGLQMTDFIWIKFDGEEDLHYEDIKIR